MSQSARDFVEDEHDRTPVHDAIPAEKISVESYPSLQGHIVASGKSHWGPGRLSAADEVGPAGIDLLGHFHMARLQAKRPIIQVLRQRSDRRLIRS